MQKNFHSLYLNFSKRYLLALSVILFSCTALTNQDTFSKDFNEYIFKVYAKQLAGKPANHFLILSGYSCPYVVEKLLKGVNENIISDKLLIIIAGIDPGFEAKENVIIDRNNHIGRSKLGIVQPALITKDPVEGKFNLLNITIHNLDSIYMVLEREQLWIH